MPDTKLYIHIFTDALKPLEILSAFKSKFSDPNIRFTTRAEHNSWNQILLLIYCI